jgi:ketosteroid isomerase-like protein
MPAALSAQQAIPAIMDEIYAAFLSGDTKTLDSHLDPDITIWVPSEAPLVLGVSGLNALRARRPSDSGVNTTTSISVHDLQVDSHQDIAWARWILVVEFSSGPVEVMRCSAVWRLVDGQWLQVHSHEDLLPGAAYPFTAPAAPEA